MLLLLLLLLLSTNVNLCSCFRQCSLLTVGAASSLAAQLP
jgi:hypothetical protein